ncbi:MAG: 6-bladed beta-propeller [Gemmatimonadetes bacterium]|nr:6-bladed beta-propeller [Gemmatimonadota bacterium]
MKQARLMMLCASLVQFGCTESRASIDAERWDSAGVEMLSYSSLTHKGSLQVSAEPAVWIEGDARIPPFDRITAVTILRDSSIVVADQGASQVHAFGADGSYLWSAGRPGGGPGEFQRLEQLFVTGNDTILAVDPRSRRITVLSPTGDYVRDDRFPESVGSPVALLASEEVVYLDQQRTDAHTVGVHHTSATWSAADPAGAAVRELLTTPGHDSYYGIASGRNVIFNPSFLRHVYVVPLMTGFALALSDEGRIDQHGRGGELLRSVLIPDELLSVEVADPQAVRDGLLESVPPAMQDGFRSLVQDLPVPARWPPIGGLIADDAHRLWVQEYQASREDEITWHVFAADGTHLDQVTTPGGFTPRVVRHDVVAGVWRDELDVQSVRLYRVLAR